MLNFLGILAYPRGLALASGPCLHHPGSLSPALFWGPVLGQAQLGGCHPEIMGVGTSVQSCLAVSQLAQHEGPAKHRWSYGLGHRAEPCRAPSEPGRRLGSRGVQGLGEQPAVCGSRWCTHWKGTARAGSQVRGHSGGAGLGCFQLSECGSGKPGPWSTFAGLQVQGSRGWDLSGWASARIPGPRRCTLPPANSGTKLTGPPSPTSCFLRRTRRPAARCSTSFSASPRRTTCRRRCLLAAASTSVTPGSSWRATWRARSRAAPGGASTSCATT